MLAVFGIILILPAVLSLPQKVPCADAINCIDCPQNDAHHDPNYILIHHDEDQSNYKDTKTRIQPDDSGHNNEPRYAIISGKDGLTLVDIGHRSLAVDHSPEDRGRRHGFILHNTDVPLRTLLQLANARKLKSLVKSDSREALISDFVNHNAVPTARQWGKLADSWG